MRTDLVQKTGSLAGTSEFLVAAPIKRGLVPSLEAVSYTTRVKRVLRALHLGRTGAHEYELARVLSDAVERVGRIHAVSIRVLEQPGQDWVGLAVVFDGAWESYVRVIWQKVARLLDLIFHNTEDYVLGWRSGYEAWGAWLRHRQTETAFLYATPGFSADDGRYLRIGERLQQRDLPGPAALATMRLRTPAAEASAELGVFGDPLQGLAALDPANPLHSAGSDVVTAVRPPFRHGVRSLVGLHRLVDLHPPGTDDHAVLLDAAQELLPEFLRLLDPRQSLAQQGVYRARLRFDEAVDWLQQTRQPPPARRDTPLPDAPPVADWHDVQGGIVSAYPHVRLGCLLLLGFDSAAALAGFIDRVRPLLSTEAGTPAIAAPRGQRVLNMGFTANGLRQAGLPEDDLRRLPEEFVHGMAARAGWLGDLRVNHPRRWRLPVKNWDRPGDDTEAREDAPVDRIDLDAVHAVLQVRCLHEDAAAFDAQAERLALHRWLRDLVDRVPGAQALALQWMHRMTATVDGEARPLDHFGFVDGIADPVFHRSQAGRRYPNQVHIGELLCGYANQADRAPERPPMAGVLPLANGSFLAVRKLRQDLARLDGILGAPSAPPLSRRTLLAKMMGRWPVGPVAAGEGAVGAPLAKVRDPARPNDFDWADEPAGSGCPLHAHARRANPRERAIEPGSRPPRIVRRSLSYGPPHVADPADSDATRASLEQERGSVFMAYNASLGEQFEVIQRWLAGGNSTGSYASPADPFFGLAEPGHRRHFRFEADGATHRLALDGDDRLHAPPAPLVRLEWGAYFFVPSLAAVDALGRLARQAAAAVLPPAWSAQAGAAEIARLQALARAEGDEAAVLAWKTTLEDPESAAQFTAASVWAAIRAEHGGVLRTPYGVLVAERALVDQVLADPQRCYTATGYLPRMHRAFGPIYLGLDAGMPGQDYERASAACNAAIMGLHHWRDAKHHGAYELARNAVQDALTDLVEQAKQQALQDGEPTWELTIEWRELIDPVLVALCEAWFGLSEESPAAGRPPFLRRGGFRWDWQPGQPPRYPGHFIAPSRYFFQPRPGEVAARVGAEHGQALHAAVLPFLRAQEAAVAATPVGRAVLCAATASGTTDFDFAARTLIGAVMGFVPTVDGMVRRLLAEWAREGTLWALRARHAGHAAADLGEARQRLDRDVVAAMQLRPVPEMVWRQATRTHALGGAPQHRVVVQPGDLVVAGLVSATQQALAEGLSGAPLADGRPGPGLQPAFGGDRWAVGAPTHACPGAPAAMAVVYGLLAALVETPQPLRAGPGGLVFQLRGRTQLPVPEAGRSGQGDPNEAGPPARAGDRCPVLAIGDSWVARAFARLGAANLLAPLERQGCEFKLMVAQPGWWIGHVASDPAVRRLIEDCLDDPERFGSEPARVVLISGGGNDLVQPSDQPDKTALFRVLRPGAQTLDEAIDEGALGDFLARVQADYRSVIALVRSLRPDLPVVLHAYDHPIPDGRDSPHLPDGGFGQVVVGPWLRQTFAARGLVDAALGRAVMARLIDRLAAALDAVAREFDQVELAMTPGTLAAHFPPPPPPPPPPAQPSPPRPHEAMWNDELHPTADGFDHLAGVVAEALRRLRVLA